MVRRVVWGCRIGGAGLGPGQMQGYKIARSCVPMSCQCPSHRPGPDAPSSPLIVTMMHDSPRYVVRSWKLGADNYGRNYYYNYVTGTAGSNSHLAH